MGQYTYAALERTTIYIVAAQLADCHGGILVGVHLDERKATISLEASLNDIAEVLEQGDKVVLGGVRGEVADIASCLPSWGLLDDHVVALNAVGWEVMVAERSGWSHAHCRHSLLLGDRWLTLLVGPVAPDCARSKPFTVHGAQGLLSILALSESNEAVASRATSLHVPHDASFRYGAES